MRSRNALRASGDGALVGALLTAPLLALLYLADQAAGLPMVVYDLFDWLARTLPGDIVIRTIETMVDLIDRAGLGETSSTAKTIENALAFLTLWAIGIAVGAVLFVVLRGYAPALRERMRYVPGLITGALVAVPLIAISLDVNITATVSDQVGALWLAIAFLTWGAALSWSYYRLFPARAVEPVPAIEPGAAAPVTVDRLSRRQFLIRVGGASATLTVLGAVVAQYLQYQEEQDYEALVEQRRETASSVPANLPNADAAVTPAPGTRPEYTPLEDHYRIDINSRPPEIEGDTWQLAIDGLVAQPATLTLDDLTTRYEPQHQYITLACISNRVGGDLTSTTRWTGASLQDVLADVDLDPSATHLRVSSQDGFYETVPLDLINADRRIMLTYNWDGIPLLTEHGYPLRIYIPDRYGMKQPKWITDIEVMDHDEDGYWVVRGWDKVAQMRATSVVDVVAADAAYEQNGQTLVPVGGIAHAGARGISKVEVQVDDGDWVAAELREPLSETTWVIWRYDWPFQAGRHTFRVRCYEGDGTPQITEDRPTFPSGATGIDRVRREL